MRYGAALGAMAAAGATACLHLPMHDIWQAVGLASAVAFLGLVFFHAFRPRPITGLVAMALLVASALVPPAVGRLVMLPGIATGTAVAVGALALAMTFDKGPGAPSLRALAVSVAWTMAPAMLVGALVFFGPDRLGNLVERDLALPLLAAILVLALAGSLATVRSKQEESA